MDPREIRIFISSTFQDMESERAQLLNKTFPILKSRAAERNVTVTEVDLRWGITADEAENGKTVKICLDEIEKSRPFFIGLLGDRYGWVPDEDERRTWTIDEHGYEWLEKAFSQGLSITEIEMEYGALRCEYPLHAYFYIKKQDCQDEDPRQKNLKDRIRTQSRYPHAEYTDAEDLQALIIRDFQELLDQLYPMTSVNEVENRIEKKEFYLSQKRAGYIPDTHHINQLNNFIMSADNKILVVSGESGMGKSALLSYWSANSPLMQQDCECLLFITGLENHKLSVSTLCERFSWEASQMTSSSGKRKVLVIDALQDLDFKRNEENLEWLDELSADKIIVAVSSSSPLTDTLKFKGVEMLEIKPLHFHQREQLAFHYFEKYRKHLSEQQMHYIVMPAASIRNTRMFMLLLDEIRRFGNFDLLTTFMEQIAKTQSDEELLDFLLQRKAESFKNIKYPDMSEIVLSVLLLSLEGLSLNDLVAVTGIPTLHCAEFLSSSPNMISMIEGRYMVNGLALQKAIWNKWLDGTEEKRKFRSKLRSWLIRHYKSEVERTDGDEKDHNLQNLVFQYWKDGNVKELYRCISPFHFFRHQFIENPHLLLQYWETILSDESVSYSPHIYFDEISVMFLSLESEEDVYTGEWGQLQIQSDLNVLLQFCTLFTDNIAKAQCVLQIANDVIRFYEELSCDGKHDKIRWMVFAGNMEFQIGNFQEGMAAYRNVELEMQDAPDVNILRTVLNNQAEIYIRLAEKAVKAGDRKAAEDYATQSINVYSELIDSEIMKNTCSKRELGNLYSNLSSACRVSGNEKKAREMQEKSMELYIGDRGMNQQDTAIELNNMAITSLDSGDLHDALAKVEKALQVSRNVYGEMSFLTTNCLLTKALVLVQMGEKVKCSEVIDQVFDQEGNFALDSETLDHLEVIEKICANSLGDKRRALRAAMAQVQLSSRLDVVRTAEACSSCAGYLLLLNDFSNSTLWYQNSISLWRRMGRYDKVIATTGLMSRIFYIAKEYEKGIECLTDSLEIAEKHHIVHEPSLPLIWKNLSAFYRIIEDSDRAACSLDKAIALQMEMISDKDPNDDPMLQMMLEERKELTCQTPENNEDISLPMIDQDEELEEFCSFVDKDEHLIRLFAKGTEAFRIQDFDTAAQIFDAAVEHCRVTDGSAVALALLLRYQAFTYELIGNKAHLDAAQEIYEEAYGIAMDFQEYRIAERIVKEQAEFMWNMEDWDQAMSCYCKQLGPAIATYGFQDEHTIGALNNLCVVMSLSSREYTWELVHLGIIVIELSKSKPSEFGNLIDSMTRFVSRALEKCNVTESFQYNLVQSIIETIDFLWDEDCQFSSYQLNGLLESICTDDPSLQLTRDFKYWQNYAFYHLYNADYGKTETAMEKLMEMPDQVPGKGELDGTIQFLRESVDFHYLRFGKLIRDADCGPHTPDAFIFICTLLIEGKDRELKRFLQTQDEPEDQLDAMLYHCAKSYSGLEKNLPELIERQNDAGGDAFIAMMCIAACLYKEGLQDEAEGYFDGARDELKSDLLDLESLLQYEGFETDLENIYMKFFGTIWYLQQTGQKAEVKYYLQELEKCFEADDSVKLNYLPAFEKLTGRTAD